MSKNRERSAKDKAFDKERFEYHRRIRELESAAHKKDIEIYQLKETLEQKDMLLVEKDDWINRLLEYMDMSEDDLKKFIQQQKKEALAIEHLDNFLDVIGRFAYGSTSYLFK